MDVMRQRIAEHMVRSKATSPHVASVTECDMTGIVRYREATKGEFERKYGFKLTYTPFIVAAAVRALLDYPMMNASVEGTEILVKRFVNIGVAVALDNGLIVPGGEARRGEELPRSGPRHHRPRRPRPREEAGARRRRRRDLRGHQHGRASATSSAFPSSTSRTSASSAPAPSSSGRWCWARRSRCATSCT